MKGKLLAEGVQGIKPDLLSLQMWRKRRRKIKKKQKQKQKKNRRRERNREGEDVEEDEKEDDEDKRKMNDWRLTQYNQDLTHTKKERKKKGKGNVVR